MVSEKTNRIMCELGVVLPLALQKRKGKAGEVTLMESHNYTITMTLKKWNPKKVIDALVSLLKPALKKVKGKHEKGLMFIDIKVWPSSSTWESAWVRVGINFEKKPWEIVTYNYNEKRIISLGLDKEVDRLVKVIRGYSQ